MYKLSFIIGMYIQEKKVYIYMGQYQPWFPTSVGGLGMYRP